MVFRHLAKKKKNCLRSSLLTFLFFEVFEISRCPLIKLSFQKKYITIKKMFPSYCKCFIDQFPHSPQNSPGMLMRELWLYWSMQMRSAVWTSSVSQTNSSHMLCKFNDKAIKGNILLVDRELKYLVLNAYSF